MGFRKLKAIFTFTVLIYPSIYVNSAQFVNHATQIS